MNSDKTINSSFSNGTVSDDSCSSPENTLSSNVSIVSTQLLLSSFLFLASILGNAFMCFLLAHFKRLQTVPNILVGDLAVVDLLNVLINGPLFVCYVVLDLEKFRGKLAAWIVSTLHVFFAFLTLATMFMMMLVRYLVISRPLKYRKAKIKKTILRAIVIKWSTSLVVVLCVYVPLFKLDLGECVTIMKYRESYSKENKQVLVRVFTPLMLLGSVVLFLLSRLALRKSKTEDGRSDFVVNRQGTQKRTEHKALNTIILTIAIFITSYAPTILRSLHSLHLRGDAKNWLVFTLSLFLFLPNAVNPFLYFFRADNFRKEIKQLWEKESSASGHDATELQVTQENSQRTPAGTRTLENRISENPRPSQKQGLEPEELQEATSSGEHHVSMAKGTNDESGESMKR